MITVLYIATDANFSGSSASLLNLIRAVGDAVTPIVLLPDEGNVAKELEKLGIKTIIHPFYCFGGERKKVKTAIHHPTRTQLYHYLTDNRRCTRYVKKKLENVHIDIVHSNTTITTIGGNLSKTFKAKHVWHIREYLPALIEDIYGGENRLRRLISSADASIFVSSELMQKWDLKCNRPYILLNAIRSEKDVQFKESKDKYFLFCAAEISPFKRPDIAIKAFSESEVWKHGYRLILLGTITKEFKQKLLALACNCVDYIEWIDYTDSIKFYFVNAAAFLMCSDFEGLGRVTAEAMLYGCPVIGRNTGGTKDLIHNGYNGYLFDTEQECAQLIRKVISGDNRELIAHAQAFVKQELTEEVYGDKIMEVYYSICG